MEEYKKETIDTYDNNAVFFANKFKDLMRVTRTEFEKFQNLLQGKKILDLGAGGGDHALYFENNGFNVTCVDLSEGMLKLCREKGLNSLKMDIENLTFKDKTFDGVWAVTSLLHLPKSNLNKVAEKLAQIIKNRGILYVCLKEGPGEGLIDEPTGKRFFSYWNKDELIELFKKNFELIESERQPFGKSVYLKIFFRKK